MLYAPSSRWLRRVSNWCSVGRLSPDDSWAIRCSRISVSVSQRQMHFGIAEDLVPQLRIVGQLPVEGEGEPLALLDVPVFERLGVAAVFLAAGGVADVPDRGRAGVPAHDVLELAAVVEPKDLAHRAHVFPFHQQLVAVRDCRSTCRRPIGPGSACRPACPESCARRNWSRVRRSGGWSPGRGDGRRRPDHTRGRVPTLNSLPERVSDDRPGACLPPISGRIGSGGVTANRPAL